MMGTSRPRRCRTREERSRRHAVSPRASSACRRRRSTCRRPRGCRRDLQAKQNDPRVAFHSEATQQQSVLQI
jgi:hypothetical protein